MRSQEKIQYNVIGNLQGKAAVVHRIIIVTSLFYLIINVKYIRYLKILI